ncbi:MAG TPA: DUF4160 domain-containing protein [Thermoanaerobaculia bacterium]
MPIISRFFGIIVTMNYREHGPPHFHAWYSGHEITVRIHDGAVNGEMPKRALGLIMEWLEMHRGELAENWRRAEARLPLEPIEPLE